MTLFSPAMFPLLSPPIPDEELVSQTALPSSGQLVSLLAARILSGAPALTLGLRVHTNSSAPSWPGGY